MTVSFPTQVLITMTAIAAAGAWPMAVWATPDAIRAAVAGSILATANVLAGYAAIARSADKPMKVFMKFVLGGMGLRLGAMAAALIVLIEVFGMPPVALVASLGVFYAAYLALEVLFLHKTLTLRQNR